jgi:hypothetical protein
MEEIRQITGHNYDIPGFYYKHEYQIIDRVLHDVTDGKIMYQDAQVLRFAIVRLDAVYFVLNVRLSYSNVRLLIFNRDFQLLQSLPLHTVDFIHCANRLITCDSISIDYFKHDTEFTFSGSKIHRGIKIMIVYRGYYVTYHHGITVYDQDFKSYKIISTEDTQPLWMAELDNGNLLIQFDDANITLNAEFNRVQ